MSQQSYNIYITIIAMANKSKRSEVKIGDMKSIEMKRNRVKSSEVK
jgi:hypothetical protein